MPSAPRVCSQTREVIDIQGEAQEGEVRHTQPVVHHRDHMDVVLEVVLVDMKDLVDRSMEVVLLVFHDAHTGSPEEAARARVVCCSVVLMVRVVVC